MICNFNDFPKNVRDQIHAFLSISPPPQLPFWENQARIFLSQQCHFAAFFILDKIAAVFGKDAARHAIARISHIPQHLRGRGLPADFDAPIHPAFYWLNHNTKPLTINHRTYVRSGANAVSFSPDDPLPKHLHLFTNHPTLTGSPKLNINPNPLDWIPLSDNAFLFSQNALAAAFADLRQIHADIPLEQANFTPFPTPLLTFDAPIRHLCGPLPDGTFLVTLPPPFPTFSDTCILCKLDIPKIQNFIDHYPALPCDIREIGALSKEIRLHNIQQTLVNDCAVSGNYFMTCNGGMQNTEIRFIDADGAWFTRFIHKAPPVAIIPTSSGCVSLDSNGQAFLWDNDKVIDDFSFNLQTLPLDHLSPYRLSLDWHAKKLYVTEPDEKTLIKSTWCVTQDDAQPSFVAQVSDDIVMLSNRSLHFWLPNASAIHPAWQISQNIATADDWQEILSEPSPAIELDPRIRIFTND